MKKVVTILLLAFAIILVVLIGLALTKPDTFHVERQIPINAAPETVFALISDFKKWDSWSPWEKLDTAMQKTFSGAQSGIGAVYEWSGNNDVGKGRMEIVEAVPPTHLRIKLDFIEPFEGHNTTDFNLKREGTTTNVTWAMHGPNQFMGKVMSVFFDMDSMIGSDFEEGLSNLKRVAEKETQDLVITRTFDAPVERVWNAWTNPAFVMKWWGPLGFTSPSCEIDFRESGRFLFCMRAPGEFGGADFYTAGVYQRIVPLELIEFTQGLSDEKGEPIDPTVIGMPPDFPAEIPSALHFKRLGNKTELTAIEYGWRVGQMRDLSEAGLAQCLDKLAESLN